RSLRAARRASPAGRRPRPSCRSGARARRAAAPRSDARARRVASRTRGCTPTLGALSRLDELNAVGAEQVAERAHEILLRRDAHAPRAEADRLAVAVVPLNIDRGRAR